MGSGNARSRRDGGGSPIFLKENGNFRIFAQQIFGLPPGLRPSPLINAGAIIGLILHTEWARCKKQRARFGSILILAHGDGDCELSAVTVDGGLELVAHGAGVDDLLQNVQTGDGLAVEGHQDVAPL